MAINVGKYVEETHLFLNKLAEELGNPEDTDTAARIVVAVFSGLRDRIPTEESFHLMSQLPLILKGVYVDGWDVSKEIKKSSNLTEFIEEVRSHNPRTQARDFGTDEQALERIQLVIQALRDYLSDGQIEHLKNSFPKNIAERIFQNKTK